MEEVVRSLINPEVRGLFFIVMLFLNVKMTSLVYKKLAATKRPRDLKTFMILCKMFIFFRCKIYIYKIFRLSLKYPVKLNAVDYKVQSSIKIVGL